MVWVPSGYFIMGADERDSKTLSAELGMKEDQIAAFEWYPKRRVYVEGFFIDKYETTNELWAKFAAAPAKETGYKPDPKLPKSPPPPAPGAYDAYPAVNVLWAEAQQYANWAGKRLPLEAQWEKAARGTDGRLYPWGNEPLTSERGVFVDLKTGKSTKYGPVGSKPAGASPYGCLDMAGNVYEWTCEWMEPYENNPEHARMATYTGHKNGCLRGGSFYHGPHSYACAKRFGFENTETYYHAGFRTVWTPPRGYFESAEFKSAQASVAQREAQIDRMRKSAAASPVSW
jgi:iron(II)-dependent oxidoreductase